jgi:hypothetical protein
MTSKSQMPRFLVGGWLLLGGWASASQPVISTFTPKGEARGSEVAWTLRGENLQAPQAVHFYDPRFEVTAVRPGNETGKVVVATVRTPVDAMPGSYPFRIRTAEGFSPIRLFFVGPYTNVVAEAEPNNFFDQPQSVPLDSTVEGVVRNEDVDYFRVEARKGERISVEVEGIRMGRIVFDPYVAILATNRFELAACDDSPLLLQDAYASVIAPYDGAYLVEVRESSYAGSDAADYRLHIGRFSRPTMVTPTVGAPGQELEVTFLGDPAGAFTQKVKLPETPGVQPVWAERDGIPAPSPNFIRVSAHPVHPEQEPNGSRSAITNTVAKAPCVFSGALAEPGDEDWHRFQAVKGHVFEVQTFARRLRSPFDPVVSIHSAKDGRRLEGGDDKEGLDPQFRWTVPEDGEYFVFIRDHLRSGGPDCHYHIAIEPVVPAIDLYLPEFKTRTQQKMAFSVPQGGRFAGLLKVRRQDIGGEMVLEWPALPEGVHLVVPPIAAGGDTWQIQLSAATNAPLTGALVDLGVRPADTNRVLRGGFAHSQPLVYGEPNNSVYSRVTLNRLPLAVTAPRPFKVWIEPPAIPVVPGGSITLTVRCERDPGFDKPVKVRLLQAPPSIGAASEIVIGKTQDRQNYRLTCSGGEARVWPIAVIAAAEEREEQTWSASDFVNLEVASPFVSGEIVMAAGIKGQTCEVVCKLNHLKPWQGEGKIELVGLPAGCKSEPRTFTTNDTQVVFQVSIAGDAPQGQHKSLFGSAEIPLPGGGVQHSLASGGVLRIDPPPPEPAPEVAKKEGEKKPDAPAANKAVLSRLEQLRLAQQQKGGS